MAELRTAICGARRGGVSAARFRLRQREREERASGAVRRASSSLTAYEPAKSTMYGVSVIFFE